VKILVTGANGFIGRATCAELTRRGHEVVAAVRRIESARDVPCARAVAVGPIGPATDWRAALDGTQAVVHTAAMAHSVARKSASETSDIFAVNAEGARALAEAAIRAGVRRLVFLGTVKVLGETTEGRAPFAETDPLDPDPGDSYARAKAAAEAALADVAGGGSLEVVVLRLPLVYGPGVKANFAALIRLARLAPPLPLASVANRRGLLFLGNLTDAIALALDHPGAAGETFMVGDGETVSTPELIRKIAVLLERPARLFSFPPGLLRLAAILSGQGARARRLLDSLELDGRKIRDRLGWRPPFSLDQGLALTLRPPATVRPRQETPSA